MNAAFKGAYVAPQGIAASAPPDRGAVQDVAFGTERLHKLIDELIQRLEPVLCPTGPDGPGVATGARSTLRGIARDIEAAGDRIGALIGRVDL